MQVAVIHRLPRSELLNQLRRHCLVSGAGALWAESNAADDGRAAIGGGAAGEYGAVRGGDPLGPADAAEPAPPRGAGSPPARRPEPAERPALARLNLARARSTSTRSPRRPCRSALAAAAPGCE